MSNTPEKVHHTSARSSVLAMGLDMRLSTTEESEGEVLSDMSGFQSPIIYRVSFSTAPSPSTMSLPVQHQPPAAPFISPEALYAFLPPPGCPFPLGFIGVSEQEPSNNDADDEMEVVTAPPWFVVRNSISKEEVLLTMAHCHDLIRSNIYSKPRFKAVVQNGAYVDEDKLLSIPWVVLGEVMKAMCKKYKRGENIGLFEKNVRQAQLYYAL